MTTAAYKKQLIERIRNTDDESILKEINFVECFAIEKCLSQPLYELSETEIQSIAEGEKDIADGKVFSSEEAANERRKWL